MEKEERYKIKSALRKIEEKRGDRGKREDKGKERLVRPGMRQETKRELRKK